MRRPRIFKVIRKGRTYFVRAFDGLACVMLAQQYGCVLDKCVPAPGHSKSALTMHTFSLLERHPSLRRNYKCGMTPAAVNALIRKVWA